MIKKSKITQAFTLIELLVVITIIGILVTLTAFGTERSFKSARDTQRKSDLDQYRTALENYANKKNGLYPSRTTAAGTQTNSATFCVTDLGYTAATDCPGDPVNAKDSSYENYKYKSNGTDGTATATQYLLWAKTESSTGYYFICSNGKSGSVASYTPGGAGIVTCPL